VNANFTRELNGALEQFKKDGVYKRLNFLASPQRRG
jgi:hypothetical protein